MRKQVKKKSLTTNNSRGFVRIISGLWRGRKLPVHDAQGLRPTTDRVKETLFNWIAQDVARSRCLDLFAGSGGLGFECASRQAQLVTLIEKNNTAFKQIESNIQTLKATNMKAISSDALLYLENKPAEIQYDLVFIDPPFHQGLLEETIEKLESNHWLSEGAKIYIETEKELTLPALPHSWQLLREKNAGQVCYRLYLKEKA